MKNVLVILFAAISVQLSNAQMEKYFELTDSHFEVNMICVKEIGFIFDKPTYLLEYQPLIDSIAKFLNDHPKIVVEIGIHTDSRGSAEYNQKISELRAQVVVDSIIVQKVPKTRVIAKGYGETKPRYLEKDYKGKGCGYRFPKGTKLTEDYINGFNDETPTGKIKYEDAHELNRRMEIKIISIQ